MACYLAAAWEALKAFPIDVASIDFVSESENVTFKVNGFSEGERYVLRLHRPGYNSLEELNSERRWTSALKAYGIDVSVPIQMRGSDGFFHLVTVPELVEQRYASITSWLDGSTLCDHLDQADDPGERVAIFARIGELAAHTHNHSESWERPVGFTRRMLNADALLGEDPYWGRFWEHNALSRDESAIMLAARDHLKKILVRYGQQSNRFGLIHSDMNTDNIICQDRRLCLIDFDDTAFGWHVYDLASALIEYCGDQGFDDLKNGLLAGYQRIRPLAAQDLQMLPVFLLIRGMVTIGWFHQRPEHDGSEEFLVLKNWVLTEASRVLAAG